MALRGPRRMRRRRNPACKWPVPPRPGWATNGRSAWTAASARSVHAVGRRPGASRRIPTEDHRRAAAGRGGHDGRHRGGAVRAGTGAVGVRQLGRYHRGRAAHPRRRRRLLVDGRPPRQRGEPWRPRLASPRGGGRSTRAATASPSAAIRDRSGARPAGRPGDDPDEVTADASRAPRRATSYRMVRVGVGRLYRRPSVERMARRTPTTHPHL